MVLDLRDGWQPVSAGQHLLDGFPVHSIVDVPCGIEVGSTQLPEGGLDGLGGPGV